MWKSAQFKLYLILKRSRDCLPYTKKDRNCDLFAVKITACTTFTSRENVLNTSCYFYLPSILYEWKYTITWLLWNATSRDANIVVKRTYFRYDRLRSTNIHRIIMATMKTDMICHIRGSNDDCRVIGTRFDGLVFRTEMSENCYTLFLTLVQQFLIRTCKTELYQSKNWDNLTFFNDAKAIVKFKHRKIVFVKVESSITRNI